MNKVVWKKREGDRKAGKKKDVRGRILTGPILVHIKTRGARRERRNAGIERPKNIPAWEGGTQKVVAMSDLFLQAATIYDVRCTRRQKGIKGKKKVQVTPFIN